eukprot:TRINITY_DN1248_c0_g1_i1.p1 TRINITY_DN1248_c0_g1~~TRINITY_DN1248_c0_g1_i1.p1  ORF type:complete len:1240 (+),score=388.64 TRINITY_DN1248_c0_g1_i1:242-3721(+)
MAAREAERERVKLEKQAAKEAELAKKKAEREEEQTRKKAEKEAERLRKKQEHEEELARKKTERQAEKEAELLKKKQERDEEAARKKGEKEAEALKKKQEKEEEIARKKAEKQAEKEAELAKKKAEKEAEALKRKQEKEEEAQRKKTEEAARKKAEEEANLEKETKKKSVLMSMWQKVGVQAAAAPADEVPKRVKVVDATAAAPVAIFMVAPPMPLPGVEVSTFGPKREGHSAPEFDTIMSQPHEFAALTGELRTHANGLRHASSRFLGKRPQRPTDLAPAVRCKMKMLLFSENTRPAYFGTFSKQSRTVKARRFLGHDSVMDYTVDSDDEWEDEEPGEDCESEGSIAGGDSDIEDEDDRDGFVVADDIDAEGDGAEKRRRVKKLRELIPVVIGVCFEKDVRLSDLVMQTLCECPVDPLAVAADAEESSPAKVKKVPAVFSETDLKEFVEMVHGCASGRDHIVQVFVETHSHLKKKTISDMLNQIATKEKREPDMQLRWYVKAETLTATGVPAAAVLHRLPPRPKPEKAASAAPSDPAIATVSTVPTPTTVITSASPVGGKRAADEVTPAAVVVASAQPAKVSKVSSESDTVAPVAAVVPPVAVTVPAAAATPPKAKRTSDEITAVSPALPTTPMTPAASVTAKKSASTTKKAKTTPAAATDSKAADKSPATAAVKTGPPARSILSMFQRKQPTIAATVTTTVVPAVPAVPAVPVAQPSADAVVVVEIPDSPPVAIVAAAPVITAPEAAPTAPADVVPDAGTVPATDPVAQQMDVEASAPAPRKAKRNVSKTSTTGSDTIPPASDSQSTIPSLEGDSPAKRQKKRSPKASKSESQTSAASTESKPRKTRSPKSKSPSKASASAADASAGAAIVECDPMVVEYSAPATSRASELTAQLETSLNGSDDTAKLTVLDNIAASLKENSALAAELPTSFSRLLVSFATISNVDSTVRSKCVRMLADVCVYLQSVDESLQRVIWHTEQFVQMVAPLLQSDEDDIVKNIVRLFGCACQGALVPATQLRTVLCNSSHLRTMCGLLQHSSDFVRNSSAAVLSELCNENVTEALATEVALVPALLGCLPSDVSAVIPSSCINAIKFALRALSALVERGELSSGLLPMVLDAVQRLVGSNGNERVVTEAQTLLATLHHAKALADADDSSNL